jgi:HK97 family phage major capsid protein
MTTETLPKIETLADIGAFLAELSTASKQSMAELNARVLATEQKQARPGGPSGFDAMGRVDLTKSFESARGMDDIRAGRQGAKALIDLPTGYFSGGQKDFVGGAPVLGQVDRATVIVPLPRMRFTIRSLLNVVKTTAAAMSFVQETGYTNAAAIAPEGTLKAQSAFAFILKAGPIVTLAHLAKTSNQLVQDFPALQQFIDIKMRYGLSLIEEQELLNGSNVGQHLDGLMTEAPAYVDATVGATKIDNIRRATADLEQAFWQPSGVVLNPLDWAEFELVKSTQGEYIIEQPSGASDSVLWSLPVVRSPTMPRGQYLVGDFQQAATIYDRMEARVELGYVNDDFALNLVTVRAESRMGLANHSPAALRKGTFA